MSLLNALLETYDDALANGLVDNHKIVNDSSTADKVYKGYLK